MKSFLKTKDHSISGEDFELLYDANLDMLVTHPRPDNLARYYESDVYISHTDASKSTVEKIYHTVKKYSLAKKVKLISRYANGKKTLLDFGAGTGDFLSVAKTENWSVTGVEPNFGAREKSAEKGVELIADISEAEQKKFQVITLWHVLEHLPNLDRQIKMLVEKLALGGTILVAVPNYKSYDAQHYKNYWAAYDVPRHLWHFSKTAIEKLFEPHGLKVVAAQPMIFDAFYVSLLSEKYKTGKPNYIQAFYRGLRSNIEAWGTKNYSSHIYILQKP